MRNRLLLLAAAAVALPLALTGCLQDGADTVATPDARTIGVVKQPAGTGMESQNPEVALFQAQLNAANAALEVQGSPYRLTAVEWITMSGGVAQGNTLYFGNVGNKRLAQHWVPGDPRRFGGGAADEITYLIDQSEGATGNGLTNAQTEPAIDRAMATWDAVTCSQGLSLVKNADNGTDPTIVDGILGFGPFGTPQAQITHAGWVGGVFSPNTIAVTYTLSFSSGGVVTDIDSNGRNDAGVREIYYNDDFAWGINTSSPIDVETIALHEAGHGLSQGHFGKLWSTSDGAGNTNFHFAPRAVMNAAYTGLQQSIAQSDEAGHCTNWGSWPNN